MSAQQQQQQEKEEDEEDEEGAGTRAAAGGDKAQGFVNRKKGGNPQPMSTVNRQPSPVTRDPSGAQGQKEKEWTHPLLLDEEEEAEDADADFMQRCPEP